MPLAIYLHIPFCRHRCAYCDFNTYAGQEALLSAYVQALIREITIVAANRPADLLSVHTVFFGGGTPSLLTGSEVVALLEALCAAFAFSPEPEVTLEANPSDLSLETLMAYRRAGVNRISLGMQSANPQELRLLERTHDHFDVIESVKRVRQAGFINLNLDLIYGLPGQTLAAWRRTLEQAVALNPEHISAYALTLEHGTPFDRWTRRGLMPMPDPDRAAEMYEFAQVFLAEHGYVHYEISNWAKDRTRAEVSETTLEAPAYACRHNLQYWRARPYLGLGAGAHGYAGGLRYSNVLRIKTYLERLRDGQATVALPFPLTPAVVNVHWQTLSDEMSDYLLNRFRLVREGVDDQEFRARFGMSLAEAFPQQVEELLRFGLIERLPAGVYRLTPRGRQVGNQVFVRFVG